MPRVIIEDGPRSGTTHVFSRTALIGRGSACDLTLDEAAVSRQHAMIRLAGNECYLADLGSANGTFVGGARLKRPVRIGSRDIVQIGASRLRVVLDDEAADAGSEESTLTWIERSGASGTAIDDTASGRGLKAMPPLEPRAAVEVLSRQLRFLEGLARASSRGVDEPSLVSLVASSLLALLPDANWVGVHLIRPGTAEVALAIARTRVGAVRAGDSSRQLVTQAAANREAIRVTAAPPSGGTTICAPIVFEDRVSGVLEVDTPPKTEQFEESDFAVLMGIAEPVGVALAQARFRATQAERDDLERDLAVARTVQQHILPRRMPDLPGWDLAVALVPASHVGGDFYDVLRLDDGVLGLVVGDVCGKGVAAALYGAKVSNDLRYLSAGDTDPASILRRVNGALAADDMDGMFVTVIVAALRIADRRLWLSSAGQPLALVRTPGGEVHSIGKTGDRPIGIVAGATYDRHEYQVGPGEAILLYSDGVTESLNRAGETFGEERLLESLRSAGGNASEIVASIRAALREFAGSATPSDDTTLLCMRYSG